MIGKSTNRVLRGFHFTLCHDNYDSISRAESTDLSHQAPLNGLITVSERERERENKKMETDDSVFLLLFIHLVVSC